MLTVRLELKSVDCEVGTKIVNIIQINVILEGIH